MSRGVIFLAAMGCKTTRYNAAFWRAHASNLAAAGEMFGRIVGQYILETGEKTLEINSENLVPGVYTYSLVVNDKQIDVKKMIITQ